MQNLDWVMLLVAASSVLLHAGLVAWVHQMDPPRRPEIDDLPPRVVSLIIPRDHFRKMEEPPVKKVEAPRVDPNHGPVTTAPRIRPPHSPNIPQGVRRSPVPAESAAASSARMHAEVGKIVNQLIGAKGGEGQAFQDLLRHGNVGSEIEDVLRHSGGAVVATRRSMLETRGGIAGRARTGGPIRGPLLDPNVVVTGERVERDAHCPGGLCPPPRKPVEVDGGCDASLVDQEMRRRRGAFTACFQETVRHNPGAGGRIVLRFEVAASGRVASASIDEDSTGGGALPSCIRSAAARFVFPPLGCERAEFAYPLIFTTLDAPDPRAR